VMLLREARRMNVWVDPTVAGKVVSQFTPENTKLPPDYREYYRAAVSDWLMVLGAFDRAAASERISPAMALWETARSRQQIQVQLVDFRITDYSLAVQKPTEEQLQAFYEAHKDLNPDATEDRIGYRFPNRVRVQYLKVPRAAVLRSITPVESADFWLKNQQRFVSLPTDEPTSQPATQPATQASSRPSTRPTTRPWVEGNDVDKEIRELLATQFTLDIARKVESAVGQDWAVFQAAAKESKKPVPDQIPKTEYGVPYHELAFLDAAAKKIEESKVGRGVKLEVTEIRRLYTEQELRSILEIGKASILSGFDVPTYVTTLAEPFINDKSRKLATALRLPILTLHEPDRSTTPARDGDGNMYVFRIAEADPARPSKGMAEVRDRVEADYNTVEALKLARQAAEKFVAVAREKGMDEAAKSQGVENRLVATDLFYYQSNQEIAKYPLPQQAQGKFIDEAFKLLQDRLRTGNEHPAGLIELPLAGRVAVASLLDAKPAEGGFVLEYLAKNMEDNIARAQAARLAFEWFEPDAVMQRAHYEGANNQGGGQ
jgi:hypothetical protein